MSENPQKPEQKPAAPSKDAKKDKKDPKEEELVSGNIWLIGYRMRRISS